MLIGHIQMWIFLALAVALFAVEIWALINAIRFRPDAYTAAGKRSKGFWIGLTALGVVLGFLSIPAPIGLGVGSMLLTIIGIVIAGVFLTDVLPALRDVMDRARRNRW